jgi:hypothetical protein
MRKAVMPFVLSMGLIAVWAAPAEAVSTRADFIAQADPICLATAQADAHALSGGVTDINKGRFKVAARKLRRAGVFFSGGVDQLAALERPPTDASLLGSWIDSLRAQVPIVNRFARALSHKQVKRIRRTSAQLLIAEDKTVALVDDFGFALCNQFGL